VFVVVLCAIVCVLVSAFFVLSHLDVCYLDPPKFLGFTTSERGMSRKANGAEPPKR
jgi:hypothetical protein